MEFKDRQNENNEIKALLDSRKFEFLILYGRRRIGKTELILHATKSKKRIYYLATGENNLGRLYNVCSEYDSGIKNLRQDYEVLFNYLKDKVEVIILDEFQNMIKEDKNIVNLFQVIIDNQLKDSQVKLFLSGSSVSLISSRVLSYKSPLYGRRTASIKLRPINFFELKSFFPKLSFEQILEVYGFTDGIPYYLIKLNEDLWSWMFREIKQERSFLRDEVDFIMKYEFENPGTYKLILEAIAHGKTKISEIKDYVKLQRTDISPYLKNLLEVDLIKREVPITENIKSRSGRYYLKDNFLRFWFRFIYPNLSSIESGIFNIETIKKEYPQYLGSVFENTAINYLLGSPIINFTKIGRWWWKDAEIDIVALNEQNKEILFGEVKWQESADVEKIFKSLLEKKEKVNWNNGIRKEQYCIFAKSFKKKISHLDGKELHCIDIKDMEKAFSQN